MTNKKNFFFNKRILVTGGSGMIGRQLVDLLINSGAKVTVVAMDDSVNIENVFYLKKDLRNFDNCLEVCKNKDIVFHLAGIKGSPKMTMEQPASFFVNTLTFSLNMMEAARRRGVKNYLFTSSIGVYSPSKIFKEEDVWKTFPSNNDKFAGWAKRICELQSSAYEIQYKWRGVSIVRPANVYGPYDNFDIRNAMVIPSLINKALNSKNFLKVWGDGSTIRDFIHSKDVARAMMLVVKKKINEPINIGSGEKTSIKQIVKIIQKNLPKKISIVWDKSKPSGDKIRLMDINKLKKLGFIHEYNIDRGIEDTLNWYTKSINKKNSMKRYNSFLEKL